MAMDAVSAWKQVGLVYLWRYPHSSKKREGWHLTAEEAACASLIELIEAMRDAGRDSRRTITIMQPTPQIWAVPNFGKPRSERLGPLTLSYERSYADLTLTEEGDRLVLRLGPAREEDMLTGLRDVRRGEGDYAFGPSEKGAALPIWFWWMPWSDSQKPEPARR